MKKITLTSILALCMACPAMANIDKDASTATCDSSTIGTTTGPANLQADWTANTINLEWYSNDSKLTVGSSSATCTYDDGITLPSTPTVPTGYTFGGWKVRVAAAGPQCDFSGLSDATANGKGYGFASHNGQNNANMDIYGLTQGSGEWATKFCHGIVKGIARCSLVGEGLSQGNTGNPTDDLNQEGASYCWCKMTGYTPKPWTYDTGDANTSPIYLTGYTNQSQCRTAIRAITGLNSTNANTLLNNASSENPQLITNATGANVAYLTDSGCTTSGATGHFSEIGNACPVASSSWVFHSVANDAANCANYCAALCGFIMNGVDDFRRAVFGISE